MRLNVGCGNHPAAGWVNLDATAELRPQVVATALALPFATGAATHVYLGHVLEHLSWQQAAAAVVEAARVAAGGELMLVGPDLDRAEAMVAAGTQPASVIDGIVHGAGRWAGDVHLWTCREARLVELLTLAGLYPEPIPVERVGEPWPVASRIGWQAAVRATIPAAR